MENEESLTHLMNYPFGPFHSSYNICWAVASWGRQVRDGLHRLQSLANQKLESLKRERVLQLSLNNVL